MVRGAHCRDTHCKLAPRTREVELRDFQNIPSFPRSPEHKVSDGLFDQASSLLRLLRTHCGWSRLPEPSAGAFPGAHCSLTGISFQRLADLRWHCFDRRRRSDHLFGISVRDAGTNLLRIAKKTDLRYSSNKEFRHNDTLHSGSGRQITSWLST